MTCSFHTAVEKMLKLSFNSSGSHSISLIFFFTAYITYFKFRRSLNIQQENAQETFNKSWERIKTVLFEEDNSIPEVDSFVQEQAQRFNFTPIIMGKDVKKETFKLVDNYHMKAIFLGNRRVDPYSGTSLFIQFQ